MTSSNDADRDTRHIRLSDYANFLTVDQSRWRSRAAG